MKRFPHWYDRIHPSNLRSENYSKDGSSEGEDDPYHAEGRAERERRLNDGALWEEGINPSDVSHSLNSLLLILLGYSPETRPSHI